jgi:hypothetical protein
MRVKTAVCAAKISPGWRRKSRALLRVVVLTNGGDFV